MKPEQKKTIDLVGIPASPGYAIGHAFIYDEASFWVEEKDISLDEVENEKIRLKNAIDEVIKDIKRLQYKLEQKVGKEEASIFDPHIMLLQDPAAIEETHSIIESGKSAEFAFFRTTRKITKAYKRVEDKYLLQRIDDIADILRRVHTKLQGKEFSTFSNIKHPVIVVAKNLSPSDTANMHSGIVLAFVTDFGGITSHATIIARSLGIPAVLGAKTASSDINPGDLLIVDGGRGIVHVSPDEETIEKYQQDKKDFEIIRKSLMKLRDVPAVTTDGKSIGMHANIEFPDEVDSVIDNGAEGVGLYRSEYHFLKDARIPTEEELYNDYQKVAEQLAPKTLIIRTFDLGGDKISHTIQSEHEDNPFLGWRAIRVSLSLKDLFRIHLKAIMRASSQKNVKIMFPMISSMHELDEAIECLEDSKEVLRKEGKDFDQDISVGIMIEIPSAVMIADHLAKKVDFFSIGTNDLIQYAVAVDRTNDRISNLFEPFHPGVLKLIKMTIDAGHSNGIPVAVCGEISSEPAATLMLLGLGIDDLSMPPIFIPAIKRIIRSANIEDAKIYANEMLELDSADKIKKLINEKMEKLDI
ncbi:phosphoenolpyruvate--protein phosphotransferase [Candidatus Latescibacterota bacterium]